MSKLITIFVILLLIFAAWFFGRVYENVVFSKSQNKESAYKLSDPELKSDSLKISLIYDSIVGNLRGGQDSIPCTLHQFYPNTDDIITTVPDDAMKRGGRLIWEDDCNRQGILDTFGAVRSSACSYHKIMVVDTLIDAIIRIKGYTLIDSTGYMQWLNDSDTSFHWRPPNLLHDLY